MGRVIKSEEYAIAIESGETEKILDDFKKAYGIEKGIGLDEIELVVYKDRKRTLYYFRKLAKEIRRHGTRIIQD